MKVFKEPNPPERASGSFETLGFLDSNFHNEIKILIPGKFLVFGFFTSIKSRFDKSWNRSEEGDFRVYKIVSLEFPGYSNFERGSVKSHLFERKFNQEGFVRLKVYLSDEFSFRDQYDISEGLESIDEWSEDFISKNEIFCNLKSGYSFRCGKSHKSYFSSKNINFDQKVTHKLSFFDVKLNICCRDSLGENEHNHLKGEFSDNIANTLGQLELLTLRLCDYLSVLAGRIIDPLYYEYEILDLSGFVGGLIIPVLDYIRLNTNLHHWPGGKDLVLSTALEAFLECCPVEDRISRGLFNLKSSLSRDYSSDLQVLAVCSSIEYYFAHWFWDMSGYDFLITHEEVKQKQKEFIESNYKNGKTPALSTFLPFFLEDIEIVYEYSETLNLLDFRNKILHGGLFSESAEFLSAVQMGRHLAASILNAVLKRVSKTENKSIYDQIKTNTTTSSYLDDSHWLFVEEARQELADFKSSGRLGKYWSI